LASFAVKRYYKQSNQWLAISHYNEDWGFIVPANKFESKAQALAYLEVYQEKLNHRLGSLF
jgi:hypothetical protein